MQVPLEETDWRRLRAAASLRGMELGPLVQIILKRLGTGRLDLPGVPEPISLHPGEPEALGSEGGAS
ncbi:hypothetical protein VT85_23815 [Planctomyces sp. SH-PL62]|nr:hypothetical protein VT85_23815 [Planctomyces sp. SH-PL62]